MAGEKYSDAVSLGVKTWYQTHLPTYLRAVETAQNLTSGSLTNPDVYTSTPLPDDQRIQCQVSIVSGDEHEAWSSLHIYGVVVGIHFPWHADLEAGKQRARQYLTALIDTLYRDHTMGAKFIHAILMEEIDEHESTSNLKSYHSVGLGLEIIRQN